MLLFINIASVVKDLQHRMEEVKTFKAKIEQTTFLQGRKTVYKGMVYLKKPDLFRWELMEPERYIVVTSGDSSWIYYNGEVSSQPVPYNLSSFLSGKYESFKVVERRTRDGWKLIMTSDSLFGFDSIVVEIDRNLLPKSIKIYNFSDWIDIKFKNVKLNEEIPDDLFVKPTS